MSGDDILKSRPKGTMPVVFTPYWWVEMATAKNGSILQLHHPEHGWLAFVFPPDHATALGTMLIKHAALCEFFAGAAPPATGTMH